MALECGSGRAVRSLGWTRGSLLALPCIDCAHICRRCYHCYHPLFCNSSKASYVPLVFLMDQTPKRCSLLTSGGLTRSQYIKQVSAKKTLVSAKFRRCVSSSSSMPSMSLKSSSPPTGMLSCQLASSFRSSSSNVGIPLRRACKYSGREGAPIRSTSRVFLGTRRVSNHC